MNKVTNKNKGCAHKKSTSQQNGAPAKKQEAPEETKIVNGLVNGIADKKIKSNKTETQTSQEIKQEPDDESKAKTGRKSKSKKRNKNDLAEATKSELSDLGEFDVVAYARNKYNEQEVSEVAKAEIKEVVSNLENLDLNKEVEEDEGPQVENPIIEYVAYQSELQMPLIMKIIQKDLSEPYSIYTYRYFIHNWPNLCFLAMCGELCVGAIVCKLDMHRKVIKRGYIAMLAVDKRYRKHGIGSTLVQRAIYEMIAGDADEVVLETEITNKPALRLYEVLGFVRDKRLFRYYLNGVDALRLKLWLR